MRILKDEKMLRMLKNSPSTGIDLLIETYGSLVGYIVRHKLSSVCSEEDVEDFTMECGNVGYANVLIPLPVPYSEV